MANTASNTTRTLIGEAKPLVDATRDALQAKGEDALARTKVLRGLLEDWERDKNKGDWENVVTAHPEWPGIIGLDDRIRTFKILLHMPVDDQQSVDVVEAIRASLNVDGESDFNKVKKAEDFHRVLTRVGVPLQELMSFIQGFFNHYRASIHGSMQEIQGHMLNRPDYLREFALQNLANLIQLFARNPRQSLEAYWEHLSIASRRRNDIENVKKVAEAVISLDSAHDDIAFDDCVQKLTDLQMELGIHDGDTTALLLSHPAGIEAASQRENKPEGFTKYHRVRPSIHGGGERCDATHRQGPRNSGSRLAGWERITRGASFIFTLV